MDNRATFGVSYSSFNIDLELPRDLVIHQNHPDDAVFLTGSPGTTDLTGLDVAAVEAEIGVAFRLGYRNLAWLLSYSPKSPLSESGRLEIQQVNDPRPPGNGSFIYTAVTDVETAHAIRTGLMFARRLDVGQGLWLQTHLLLDVGTWDMTFEKGWTRFGSDQAAITASGSGDLLVPMLRFALSTDQWSIQVGVGVPQIDFSHDLAFVENHTADGLVWSFGGAFKPRKRIGR